MMALSVQPIPQSTDFSIHLRHLRDSPEAIAEGALWVGCLGMNVVFLAGSLNGLYATLTGAPVTRTLEKIGSAVKRAFLDILSMGSSMAYTARWAHGAQIVALGRYMPLVNQLCFGIPLVYNGMEAAGDLYTAWEEKGAMEKATHAQEKGKHGQLLCHSLVRLVGNVSMVAWAALGLASLAGVLTVSPLWMSMTLGTGCVFGISAAFYKMHLDRNASH